MYFWKEMYRKDHYYFKDGTCIGMDCFRPGIRVTIPDDCKKFIFGHKIFDRYREVMICTNWFDCGWVCPTGTYSEDVAQERITKGWRSSIW